MLKKVESVPSLWRDEVTGNYYIRKSRTGKKPLCKNLKTTNLKTATNRMPDALFHWLGEKPKSDILFEDLYVEMLPIARSKSESWFKGFTRTVRLHLSETYDGISIADVEEHWDRHKANMRLKGNRKLIQDKKILSSMLHYAKRKKYIKTIPELEVDEGDKKNTPGREVLNDEIFALLDNAEPRIKLQIKIMVYCGARHVDVRNLKWADIDFKNFFMVIGKDVDKNRTGRLFAFDPELATDLLAWRASLESRLLKRNKRKKRNEPFPLCVFPSRYNWQRAEGRSDKAFQKLKNEFDIKIKRHWLRHTHVTRALRAGISGSMIQISIGMSEKVMRDIYQHVNIEDERRRAEVVRRSLTANSGLR